MSTKSSHNHGTPSVRTRAAGCAAREECPRSSTEAAWKPRPSRSKSIRIKKQIENEAFAAHVLTVKIDGVESQAVLKSVHREPATERVIHMDFQRISASSEIHMHVPLHFMNEEISPGRKAGGIVTHLLVEVEVGCLPKDLPEYIEVDMAELDVGDCGAPVGAHAPRRCPHHDAGPQPRQRSAGGERTASAEARSRYRYRGGHRGRGVSMRSHPTRRRPRTKKTDPRRPWARPISSSSGSATPELVTTRPATTRGCGCLSGWRGDMRPGSSH